MNPNFLYVGSDGAELSHLRESLKSSTYAGAFLTVVSARDKDINLLSFFDYDLVFLQADLIAPNFMDSLRESERCLPVIFLMAKDDPVLLEAILKSGAVDCLSVKDLEQGQLSRCIRYALNQQKLWLAIRSRDEIHHHLTSIIESSEDAMFSETAGVIVTWNQGAEELFGYSAAEAIGQTFELFTPPERVSERLALLDRVRQGERIVEHETLRRRKDGTLVEISLSIAPLFDAVHHVNGASCTARDNTRQKRDQAAVERSEKLYATLARNFPNGFVLLLDGDLRFVLAEGRGLVQIGLDREQMIGRSLHEVFDNISGGKNLESLYEHALQGEEINAEVIISGMYHWVHVLPIRENGEISGVMGMSQDITGLKQTERALRESEEMNQAILDSMLANIVVLDGQGIITAVNEPWRQFARENNPNDNSIPQYGIGINYLDTQSSGDLGEQSTDAADGIREVLDGRKSSFSIEYACHSSTQERWFQMTVTPLSALKQGVVVAHIPITERKQAEEELRRNQEQLTLAQGIAHLGHMQYDAKLGKSFWSDEVYRIYGLEPQSIEGNYQQFLNFVHPEDRWMLSPATQEFYANEGTIQHEFRIVRPDGEIRWVNGQAQGYHDEAGNLTSFIGTIFDITNLKQTQNERDRFFELSIDIMMISDLQGIIRRVNPAWTRILGYSSEEILGRKFVDFVHPDDMESTLEEASKIREGENVYGFENRYRCRDGSYKLLEWNSILHSATGLIYSVSTDVTERRDAACQ
jgi:PAS domain S-box-containing protein